VAIRYKPCRSNKRLLQPSYGTITTGLPKVKGQRMLPLKRWVKEN
jgi:hypothetical protein